MSCSPTFFFLFHNHCCHDLIILHPNHVDPESPPIYKYAKQQSSQSCNLDETSPFCRRHPPYLSTLIAPSLHHPLDPHLEP